MMNEKYFVCKKYVIFQSSENWVYKLRVRMSVISAVAFHVIRLKAIFNVLKNQSMEEQVKQKMEKNSPCSDLCKLHHQTHS